MNEPKADDQIAALEERILLLDAKLQGAKDAVRSWTEANTALSQKAAEERAKNQGAGRGLFGTFMGAKYQRTVRAAAAASNADLSKNVAEKRGQISDGKRTAQEAVRTIQQALVETKAQLKELTTVKKAKSQVKTAVAKSAGASLDLLQKLKQAHDDGLLTAEEYEEKRKKLVADL